MSSKLDNLLKQHIENKTLTLHEAMAVVSACSVIGNMSEDDRRAIGFGDVWSEPLKRLTTPLKK